jgi:hypothetical protein
MLNVFATSAFNGRCEAADNNCLLSLAGMPGGPIGRSHIGTRLGSTRIGRGGGVGVIIRPLPVAALAASIPLPVFIAGLEDSLEDLPDGPAQSNWRGHLQGTSTCTPATCPARRGT